MAAVLAFYGRDLVAQARRIGHDRVVQRFWLGIALAFLPAALVGFLLRNAIKAVLFTPLVVGVALLIGGAIFLLIERRPRAAQVTALEGIGLRTALLIGVAQMTALVPGVSRSGASMVGGLLLGLDRRTATAFSFYLALPTLGTATLFDLLLALREGAVTGAHLPLFGVGALVSFVVAWLSIAWLLRYVSRHTFRLFGYYRMAAGAAIIALVLFTDLFGGLGMAEVLIRRLASLEEYRAVEQVERAAWSIDDARDLVPLHVLITAQKNGGLVAGASIRTAR